MINIGYLFFLFLSPCVVLCLALRGVFIGVFSCRSRAVPSRGSFFFSAPYTVAVQFAVETYHMECFRFFRGAKVSINMIVIRYVTKQHSTLNTIRNNVM